MENKTVLPIALKTSAFKSINVNGKIAMAAVANISFGVSSKKRFVREDAPKNKARATRLVIAVTLKNTAIYKDLEIPPELTSRDISRTNTVSKPHLPKVEPITRTVKATS